MSGAGKFFVYVDANDGNLRSLDVANGTRRLLADVDAQPFAYYLGV